MGFNKVAVIAMLAAVVGTGCSFNHAFKFDDGPTIQGSGKLATKEIKVAEFDRLSVEGPVQVHVKIAQGPPKVTATADDNLLPHLRIEVDGNRLEIDPKGNLNSKNDIKVTIQVASLNQVSIAGSGSVDAVGVKGEKFSASVAGSGSVKISGSADLIDLSVTGSGSIDTFGMQADRAEASITGSGEIKVQSKTDVKASITGSGLIRTRGGAAVKKNIVGSGEIVQE